MKIIKKGFASGRQKDAVRYFTEGNLKDAVAVLEDMQGKSAADLKLLGCCLFLSSQSREARLTVLTGNGKK